MYGKYRKMEHVTYPDGETVGYGYDAGGQVTSVTGKHYGHDFVYVSDIGYDEFGQRAYIEYGTGVRTDYEYDENRRWLSSIETTKAQKKYQNISYSFDLVGNVLGYTNDCSSGGGYRTSQTYSYDSLYQLINATGSTHYEPVTGGVVPEHESTYTQKFNFDILGNMTSKTSTETVYPEKTIGDALNYSIDFSYAEGFAHRLDHAGDRYYSYDDDGNVVRERNEAMQDSSGTDTGSDDDEWDDWDDDWGDGLGEAGFGFGMGGVFNTVNLSLYHYAGNNPIKYTDPDGNNIVNSTDKYIIARLEKPMNEGKSNEIDSNSNLKIEGFSKTLNDFGDSRKIKEDKDKPDEKKRILSGKKIKGISPDYDRLKESWESRFMKDVGDNDNICILEGRLIMI